MIAADTFRDLTADGVDIDLARAALEIARLGHPNLEPEIYLTALDDMAGAVSRKLNGETAPTRVAETISAYLFNELEFVGNEEDYYNPKNSFLNEVIDSRTGIPITLSVLFLEVAWRLGLPMSGVSFPGKFLVGWFRTSTPFLVDPFAGGNTLDEDGLRRILSDYGWEKLSLAEILVPCAKHEILARMLRNLKGIYLQKQDFDVTKTCIEYLLILDPGDTDELRDRGLIAHQLGQYHEARADLLTYIDRQPDAADTPAIRQMLESARYDRNRLN